jgi:hypothetical protein
VTSRSTPHGDHLTDVGPASANGYCPPGVDGTPEWDGGCQGRTEGQSREQAGPDHKTHANGKGELSTGSELPQGGEGGGIRRSIGSLGVSAMSDRGSGAGQTVVPLATQSNARSEAGGDPLDAAGKAILGSLRRAASAAEANYQQALEMTDKLSAGLRAAEDRIRELEAKVRHHQDRADRAEKWLYQVSGEIEQKFFPSGSWSSLQPPPQQALSRNQPR